MGFIAVILGLLVAGLFVYVIIEVAIALLVEKKEYEELKNNINKHKHNGNY